MGCDTSKESVQPAAEDNTDKDELKSAAAEAEPGRTEAGGGGALSFEQKSRVASINEKEEDKKDRKEEEEEEEEEEAAAAATRIQAVFRGHHARKSMKAAAEGTTGVKSAESAEPSQQQLRDEFRADDEELCNAATKIQASFRGHMSRKDRGAGEAALGELADSAAAKIGELVDGTSAAAAAAAAKIEEKMDDALNELDGIDLKDPDLHKAATKIQASFRGHKVRQEVTPGGAAATE